MRLILFCRSALGKLRVAELRAQLQALGLPTAGLKQVNPWR